MVNDSLRFYDFWMLFQTLARRKTWKSVKAKKSFVFADERKCTCTEASWVWWEILDISIKVNLFFGLQIKVKITLKCKKFIQQLNVSSSKLNSHSNHHLWPQNM